jgi:hypothetical protein
VGRTIKVEIVGDADKLDRAFKNATRSTQRFGRSMGQAQRGALAGSGAFRSMGRSLAFASAGFLSFAAAAQGIRSSIQAASDLTEEINKTKVVFHGSEKAVLSWSRALLPAFGLTRAEALKTAATFGNMLVPMGFARKEAAGMSKRLVELAGDLASFNNAAPVDTLFALQAGLAGQVRPLRRFGVFLNQARIQAVALSTGIVKANVDMGKLADAQTKIALAQGKLADARRKYGSASAEAAAAELQLHSAERELSKILAGNVPKLTNAQKALATYRIILKDTADAQGDAKRTGSEFAGQMRSLHAIIGNLQEEIGSALMPTVLQYSRSLSRWLAQSRNQEKITQAVKDAVRLLSAAVKGAAAVLVPMARAAKAVAEAMGGWRNAFAVVTGLVLANKFLKLARAIRGARLAMIGLTKNPWVLTVTVSVIGLNAGGKALAKKLGLQGRGFAGLGDDVTSSNDLSPVKRNGKWVNPVSGKPVPNQRAAETFARQHGPRRFPDRSPEDVHAGIHSSAAARRQTPVSRSTQSTAPASSRRAATVSAGFSIPLSLQLEQAKAEVSRGQAAIVAAAKHIRAFLLHVIPKLQGQKLLDAYGALASANDTIASAAQEAAAKAKDAAEQQRAKLKQAREAMAQAVDNVRQQIGELFEGPVLNPSEADQKRRLGVPGPKATDLVKDLRAQTAQFRHYQRDLNILAKRGAPKGLIKELRAKGPAALPQVEALVHASRQTLNAFFKAFRGREKLAFKTAKIDLRTNHVSIKAARVAINGLPAHLRHHPPRGPRHAPRHPPRHGPRHGPRLQHPGTRPHHVARIGGGLGGQQPIQVHSELVVDGKKLAHSTTTHQQRAAKRTATQRRGRFAGQIVI